MLEQGQIIGGDFRVLRPLGEGGMGVLFVAEQLSTGRHRALKVMHQRLVGDATLRERFVREARVGAMVRSGHIADVVAAGVEDGSGLPWLAMELLEGQDLHDHIAQHGPYRPEAALAVVKPIAHALSAAHAAGVIHRDLKPRNVFIARGHSPDYEVVKLLDFGIAKLLSYTSHTRSTTLGSPGWMAPEQSDPEAEVSPAADVWALGLLVFFILSGKPFWLASNNAEASLEMLLREVVLNPIPAAHERAAALGVPLDANLDPWFQRCLRRDPAQRYPDAATALEALEAVVLGGEVVASAPPTRPASPAAHARHFPPATPPPPTETDIVAVRPGVERLDARTRASRQGAEAPVRARKRWALLLGLASVGLASGGVWLFSGASARSTPWPSPADVAFETPPTTPRTTWSGATSIHWVMGKHALASGDLDGDGHSDFVGLCTSGTPQVDPFSICAFDGRTFGLRWRVGSYAADPDPNAVHINLVGGKILVVDPTARAQVLSPADGRELGHVQLSDRALELCPVPGGAWIRTVDQRRVSFRFDPPSTTPASLRPDGCPMPVDELPAGFDGVKVESFALDGSWGAALGLRDTEPSGTRYPMVLGFRRTPDGVTVDWQRPTADGNPLANGGRLSSLMAPIVTKERVLVGLYEELVAFERTSGATLWRVPSTYFMLHGDNDRLYVGRWSRLDVRDAATGRLLGGVGRM